MTNDKGFTLIEALVALAILAIATVGLVRAAEAHVDSIGMLEARSAAGWVAVNRLAELQLTPGAASEETEMLGRRWRSTVTQATTADPDLRAVTVKVAPADAPGPTASLEGFVDAGAQP